MMKRMTDEEIAELDTIDDQSLWTQERRVQIMQALKAERERIAELEAHCEELQRGKHEALDRIEELEKEKKEDK